MNKKKLILGSNNSGKTTGILFNDVENSIRNNENLLILDVKREYYKTYCEKLNNEDYNVLCLNLSNPEFSNSWNPLILPYQLYKNNKKDESMKLIKDISLNICRDDSHSDPFWEKSAANYISGLILILFKNAKEEEINLGSIGLMIKESNNGSNDKNILTSYLENSNPLDPIYLLLSGIIFAPYETKASILSVVMEKVNNILIMENLMNMLNGNEIDLSNLKSKNAIFITSDNDVINKLSIIFINQLITSIKNEKDFTLILDDLDKFKSIPNFDSLIGNESESNLKISVAFKSINKLKDIYGNYIDDIFDEVIDANDMNLELTKIGNYNIYPNGNINNVNYFRFENSSSSN